MSQIRRVSVHVDDREPGHSYWVLMEEGDDTSEWRDFESADEAYALWLDVLQAGTRALLGYAPDERFGPREVGGDDDDAAHVGIPIE